MSSNLDLLTEGKVEDAAACLATMGGDADVTNCDDDDEPETDEEEIQNADE